MKKMIKALYNQWPALLCVVFIGSMLFIASGEERTDLLAAYGIPIILAFIYLLSLIFGGRDENSEINNDDLITRLGSYWLKITLPKKPKPGSEKLKK